MRPARRFVAVFLIGLLASFGGILAVTAGIDPYGLSPLDPDLGSLNAIRMERRQLDRMIKPLEAIEQQPRTLLLGTSRVRQGFDGDSFAGTGLAPAYNLGINFSSLNESTTLLETILPFLPSVETIVFEFNFVHYYYPKGPQGVPAGWQDLLHNLATAFLSTDAVAASIRTVLANRNYSGHYFWIEEDGLMFMSPASMVQDIENFFTNVVRPFPRFASGPVQQGMLQHLKAICDRHGIRCIFAVLPYLPADLAYSDINGNWDGLVAAKREIMADFPILDMTMFNRITTEPLSDGMTYWTDVNHFKPLVGSYIADRLAGRENPEIPENFGIWLTGETFAARMAEWRAGMDAWKAAHPDAVARIQASLERNPPVFGTQIGH
ncbi:MAG: hypothetical protein RIB84_16200 [Sneathiellaceae bacterium]